MDERKKIYDIFRLLYSSTDWMTVGRSLFKINETIMLGLYHRQSPTTQCRSNWHSSMMPAILRRQRLLLLVNCRWVRFCASPSSPMVAN
ncbi:hypothetical protein KIN20_037967 [Parelaphostrongylus tenuis]|uniref:Uncharacterized protein n=1 Tax=Parelaphostrongylus tenuis TaxID=148309 RepID=A0AAD5REY9_PARTN|nr:hypothetical protein KIN20_037967 [Parelaphostrongylus tenuis]